MRLWDRPTIRPGIVLKVCLFPLVVMPISSTTATVAPGRSVVLPPEHTDNVLRQCSRPTPREVEGTWIVPPDVVDQLEANLGKLSRLRARQCCMLKARVRDPGLYFRQYVGIVVSGRRLVYVNAFRSAADRERWRDRAVDVCDGGDDYWGAIFDPETEDFSQLAFNGLA